MNITVYSRSSHFCKLAANSGLEQGQDKKQLKSHYLYKKKAQHCKIKSKALKRKLKILKKNKLQIFLRLKCN